MKVFWGLCVIVASAMVGNACSSSDESSSSSGGIDAATDAPSNVRNDSGADLGFGADSTVNPYPCDVVQQDCGAGLRCTLIESAGGHVVRAACVPLNGTRKAGDACGGNDAGCAAGLLCTIFSEIPKCDGVNACVCERFCHTDADCGLSGAKCLQTPYGMGPNIGVCHATCTAFSNVCGPGSSCATRSRFTDPPPVQPPTFAFVCKTDGTKSMGDECNTDPFAYGNSECSANQVCLLPPYAKSYSEPHRCFPLCDAAHPCAEATACQEVWSDNFGVCVKSCTGASDCPPTDFCEPTSTLCRTKLIKGAACLFSAQCQSGICGDDASSSTQMCD